MNGNIPVLFLWHMHQPSYFDPDTGRSLLPWVRLHATKDYYDMARYVESVPGMKASFNLVPSLLDQLERTERGELVDDVEAVSRLRAEDLTPSQKHFMTSQFFSCHPETMIHVSPRYQSLYDRYHGSSKESLVHAPAQDFRDLAVWFHLAWCGNTMREEEPVQSLLRQGKDYSEDDKIALLNAMRAFCGRVIPYYKELSEQGRIEITSTPYYHPILPLLCDVQSARVAIPNLPLPTNDFSLLNDARQQVQMAVDFHRQRFGTQPAGFWPSEGSVSPIVARLLASEGVRFACTDEEILRVSLGQDQLSAEQKFRPYHFDGLTLFFRDTKLSDAIGFHYYNQPVKKAVQEFIGHLESIHKALPEGEFVIPIILDGENAWEAFPEQGRLFLTALYHALVEHPTLDPCTCSDVLNRFQEILPLPRLHSGSWIRGNFTTWIGDPVKNKAWTALFDMRRTAQAALDSNQLDDDERQELMSHILAAEGSDWWWWFGEGNTSAHDAEFDALFRKRLKAIWRLLERPAPAMLESPLDNRLDGSNRIRQPVAFLQPRINGKSTTYGEWLSAGSCYPKGGVMQFGTRQLKRILFGFDTSYLYLRMDLDQSMAAFAAGDFALDIVFRFPSRISIRLKAGEDTQAGKRLQWPGGLNWAYADCIELALPFTLLKEDIQAGEDFGFAVVRRVGDQSVERLPEDGLIVSTIPTEYFNQENWMV